MSAWVPIVAAFIAALTASVGYFLTQRVSTIQARRQTYASALLAVESYKQLPYRIRRRGDDAPASRSALGSAISDCERDLDYYVALMDLEASAVARRFRALATLTRIRGTAFREQAWREPPLDRSRRFSEAYMYDDRREVEACKEAMRSQLKILGFR